MNRKIIFIPENNPKKKSVPRHITLFVLVLILTTYLNASEFTRGIGIYPGNPEEDFSPTLQEDNKNFRNLALHRQAFHSSSYDYNLTAQLVTDGIIETSLPGWISTSSSLHGRLMKNHSHFLIDRNTNTNIRLDSSRAWIQIQLDGNSVAPEVDSIFIAGSLLHDSLEVKGWDFSVAGSNNGSDWETLGHASGTGLPGDSVTGYYRSWYKSNFRFLKLPVKLEKSCAFQFYRAYFNSPNVLNWNVGEFGLLKNRQRVQIGGPFHFTSAWKSEGNQTEWIYIDLGTVCCFDQIVLHWIRRAAAGSIQISDDGTKWNDLISLPSNSGLIDDLKLKSSANSRFVRLLLKQAASSEGYILSEFQIFGRGGLIALHHPAAPLKENGRLDLAGGNWRLQRASQVKNNGNTLSKPGFADQDWMIATVPATVLVSYLNLGAVPDPNFSNNQVMISDSYFWSDFWYRNEFAAPASYRGKRVLLNFDGINWKAEVFLNGEKLGRIEGGFMRGLFDVTNRLIPGQKNALAVRIEKNDTPGFVTEQTIAYPDANGGELGADNPTFHASVGWDWIPTIRGRNNGIWNDVYFTINGPVTINHPFVTSDLPLPDTTRADISIEVTLQNHESKSITGVLCGTFGKALFEQSVTLEAGERKLVKINPESNPALKLKKPKLWWPAGYGKQNLYPVEIKFLTPDSKISDMTSFLTGVREINYSENNEQLKIFVNGRRFAGRGGNWGFSESMLRYRAREYDIAVRYHKEMNFTMIRNWVGQTGDEEFFEACDRHGIMIWQDFWLANPVDGPDPNDNILFLRNAEDFVLRIRNHPSVGLYCGRNEGNPPDEIDNGLRKIIAEQHPGLHYISNSLWGVVSGGGPYRAMTPKFYFERRATTKLHSEMGMPNALTYESLKQMLPDSAIWPQNNQWGLHDFCLKGAQGGNSFNQQMTDGFGAINNAHDWTALAQWLNYQGYRAMFEAQSKHRMGLLLWMSHSAWPSMVWQTYDYYFEPTAAYFGCKKASEPLHILWNALTDSIEVFNYSIQNGTGLTAKAELLNLDGSVQWTKDISLDCPEDRTVRCFKMEYPADLNSVYFLRLKLNRGTQLLSENFYWRGKEEGKWLAVRELPKVNLKAEMKFTKQDDCWNLAVRLQNPTKTPALMVRLKVVREKTGDRILPVIYSDNYVSLMPGEERTIQIEVAQADTRGEKPQVVVEGVNVLNIEN